MLEKKYESGIFNTYFYLVVFTAIFLVASYPFRNFLGDDSYIHLQYAENLQKGLGFCFNPGDPTYGTTSPLWTSLIALVGFAFPSNIIAAKVLCYLFSLGAIYIFHLLSRRIIGNSVMVIIALFTLVIDPWFVRWSLSGMEVSFKIFLVLTALYLHLRERDHNRNKYLSGFIFAMATLTRPEVFGIVLIVGLDILINDDKRKFIKALQFALVYLAVLVPWEIYCYITFDSLLPHTVSAKDYGFNFIRVKHSFTTISKILLGTYGILILSIVVYSINVIINDGFGVFIKRLIRRHFATALPIILVVLSYGLRGFQSNTRQLLIILPLVIIYGYFALARLIEMRKLIRLSKLIIVSVVLFEISISAVIQKKLTYHVVGWPRGVDENLIQLGEWLRDNTPEDALVAVGEIGAIGYFSKRPILDLNCLVTPELRKYQRSEGGTPAYIKLRKPDYLVTAYSKTISNYIPSSVKNQEEVFSRWVQRGGSRHAGQKFKYTIYKLEW